MKKIHLIIVALLVIVGVAIYVTVVKPQLDNRMVVAVVDQTIKNEPLDFEFTYPSGEEGYTMIEPVVPTTTASGLQKVYIIMDSAQYIEFQGASDTETPPSVSVFVLNQPEENEADYVDRITSLRKWAEANPQFSSLGLKTTDPEEIDLDGVTALRYKTDGLYQQEVYLALHRGKIYVFTGQYNDESDAILEMFNNMITSVSFY